MAVNVAPSLSAHDLSVLIDFLLFGATLAGVAIFHRHTLAAALIGLGAITLKKLLGTGFNEGPGLAGLFAHYEHEWVLLANLFLLLVGFALLARHFEASRVPDWMPAALPDNWTGGFVLLLLVFVISSFLDNIAAALIGATVARHVFKGRVRIGYLAAIVAAANAGGAGSVLGDTTTTMLWIAGVSPLSVVHAYVAAVCALFVSGIPASLAQQKYAPIVKDPPSGLQISFRHVGVVIVVLASAIAANVGAHLLDAHILDDGPAHRTCGRGGNSPDGANRATGLVDRSPRRARRDLSPRPCLRGIDDAGQILAIAQLGDSAWARLRLGRVRQYSVDRARHKAGQL